jgi:phage-related protein
LFSWPGVESGEQARVQGEADQVRGGDGGAFSSVSWGLTACTIYGTYPYKVLLVTKQPKKIPAFFYQTPAGAEPVRDWLKKLDDDDRRVIGEDVATVEYGWPVGMPICRSLGGGLWEVRSSLPSRREARVIFVVLDEQMLLLHGFIKKTQNTPKADLDLATKRMKEMKK